MTLYAETPALRARQLLADGLLLVWSLAWVATGVGVYRLLDKLAALGRALESSGRNLSDELGSASDQAGGLPLVGDRLAAPFRGAADASGRLADAGVAQQDSVGRLALTLGLVVALTPILAVLAAWLPWRLRWVREAGAAAQLRVGADGSPPELELLALRALARRPIAELRAVSAEPWTALRNGDSDVISGLAALELRNLGLGPTAPQPALDRRD